MKKPIPLDQPASCVLMDYGGHTVLDGAGEGQGLRREPPKAQETLLHRPQEGETVMQWCRSHRFDPAARVLADRHYSRQKVGTPQFVATGSCCVFLTDCGQAVWVTSWPQAEYVRHAWPGAWMCTMFRSEGAGIASTLIRDAVSATLAHYGEPPTLGMVTLIDRRHVRPTMVRGKAVYGWTWIKAGFTHVGETKRHKLLAFQMLPSAMPQPMAARPRSMHGTPLFDAKPVESVHGVVS